MLERQRASLRSYLATLPGVTAARADALTGEVIESAGRKADLGEDPVVWLFAEGRHRVLGSGTRADVLASDDPPAEDGGGEGEDPRVAVHRGFQRLTAKQQEALRLKFQFGFGVEEIAEIAGVGSANASALLHHAMQHLLRATRPADDAEMNFDRDPRLVAFAFDELTPVQKKSFVDRAGDGKRLLERAEALRRIGQILTQVLASGAPVPRRRRKKGAGGWGRVWVIGIVLLAVLAGGVFWYRGRGSVPAERSASTLASVPDDPAVESPPVDRGPNVAPEVVATPAMRRKRDVKPGEAAWERKAFGKGVAEGGDAQTGGLGGGNSPIGGPGGGPSGGGAGGGSGGNDDAPKREEVVNKEKQVADAEEDFRAKQPDEDIEDVQLEAAVGGAGDASPRGFEHPTVTATLPAARASLPTPAAKPGAGREAQARERDRPAALPAAPLARLREDHLVPKVEEAPPVDDTRAVSLRATTDEDGPEGPPLRLRAEVSPSPWNAERSLVRISVIGRSAPLPDRRPANLVLAIDVSESMTGPNRLPLVQEGVRRMAERLRPEDRIAIVTYAATAKLTLASTRLGESGLELKNALAALHTSGRTNGSDGLRLAYDVARQEFIPGAINAVVLCTDGNFNLGETEPAPLAALAGAAAKGGVRLSVFGFGRTDRNDLRLEMLAQAGGGRSCYVNTRDEAERLLVGQIDQLFAAAASDVELRVNFDGQRVAAATRVDAATAAGATIAIPEVLPGRSASVWYEVEWRGRDAEATRRPFVRVDWAGNLPRGGARQRATVSLDAPERPVARQDASYRYGVGLLGLARLTRAEGGAAGPALDRLETWVNDNFANDASDFRQELLDGITTLRGPAGTR